MKKTDTKEPELFTPADPAPQAKPPAKAKHTKSQEVAKVDQMPPQPRSMLEVIYAAAVDPRCDPAKVRELYEIQKDIEDRDARKAFTRAFNALQFELPTIDKDGYIDHGDGLTARGNAKMKARYSTYPNLMSVCRPLLKKHGMTFNNVIEPSVDGTKSDVVGYLTHVDGHGMKSHFPLTVDVTGKKNNQQGFGSGASYAKRYNLVLLLDIVSEAKADQDNDGYPKREDGQTAALATVSKAQEEELRLAIEDAGLPEERFLSKYQIESLGELPAKVLAEARKDVAAFKRKHTGSAQHG